MGANGKIPATVITGFLGAGKTSTIRHLLQNAQGKRLALVINEFGDLGVDGEIIKGCGIEGCRPSRACWSAPSRPTTSSSRPRAWPCPSR